MNLSFQHLIAEQTHRPDSILWLEGDGNYTRIHRPQQPMLLSAHTLKRFEEQLAGFIRVRRDALVNPLHISRFQKSNSVVVRLWLTDGTILTTTRRKYGAVLVLLKQLNVGAENSTNG